MNTHFPEAICLLLPGFRSMGASMGVLLREPAPIEGFGLEEIEWGMLAFSREDRYVMLSGTIQEMYVKLKETNTNIDQDFPINHTTTTGKRALEKRNNFDRGRRVGGLRAFHVGKGQQVTFEPSTAARVWGWAWASRVSLSWNSGIFWCSDVRTPYSPQSPGIRNTLLVGRGYTTQVVQD